MIPKIRAINIILPFWLRWLKRFVKLEVKEYSLPKRIRGQKIDVVIIDEVKNINLDKIKFTDIKPIVKKGKGKIWTKDNPKLEIKMVKEKEENI